jgi:hypothetical protein
MTSWGDLAVSNLLGGISEVLGGPAPAAPPPAPKPPPYPGTVPEVPPYPGMPVADPTSLLTPDDMAALSYMGIDPATASLADINKALTGLGKAPLSPAGGQGPAVPPGVPPVGPTPPIPPTTPAADDGLSGAAADAAKTLDSALEHNRSAINAADDQLADAILNATTSSDEGKSRLQGLQQSIIDEVKKLGPTLDTPAGQQQLANFLQGKTSEITDIVKSAGLDSASHGAVLDALAARYQALGDAKPGSEDGGHGPGGPAPAPTPGPAGAPAPAAGGGADVAPGNDPLLNGLPPDPLSGLSSLAGPLGALGGLPGMMGGMSPFGGGGLGGGAGLPIGDIGSAIGSALHDAGHNSDGTQSGDKPDDLKDQSDPSKSDQPNSHDPAKPDPLKDPDTGKTDGTKPAAGTGDAPPPAAAAAPGQVPAPAPTAADTTVKLPDGTPVTADNAALAKAGRTVLGGADINDAYQQAGMTLSPPGTPVTSPVSPAKLAFGDVGQFTDHRVMALGGGKVWVNGQVSPIDQLSTGPNFLGWEHPPTAPTPAPAPVPVATPAAAAQPPPPGTL